MRWHLPEHRLALARLLIEGRLAHSSSARPVIDALLEAGWIRQTPRRREVELIDGYEPEVRALLDRLWPGWAPRLEALRQAGLPLTVRGLGQLERTQTHSALPGIPLPQRLNQKTLAARFERHSKIGSAQSLAQRFPEIQVTTDDVLRLRTPAGLALIGGDGQRLPCDSVMALCGEVVLSERALLDGVALAGRLEAVVTVENPGAFVDLPLPDGWLAMLVPGWNSSLALRLLGQIPEAVPLVHFGDLDPEGLDILCHLRRALNRPVRWFVPAFWEEYLEAYGLPLPPGRAWPLPQKGEAPLEVMRPSVDVGQSSLNTGRTSTEVGQCPSPDCASPTVPGMRELPPLVQRLMETHRWLEQEVIVLDPRLGAALAAHVTP